MQSGGFVRTSASAVNDSNLGALATQSFLASQAVNAMLNLTNTSDPFYKYTLAKLQQNIIDFNTNYTAGKFSSSAAAAATGTTLTAPVACSYPQGVLRPSPLDAASPTCSGSRFCGQMGLLTADGRLEEGHKNAKLHEFASLRPDQSYNKSRASSWFGFVGSDFGSGSTTSQSIRSTFTFAWPVLGYQTVYDRATKGPQRAAISNYVVSDFLVYFLEEAKHVSDDLFITFEPSSSGALEGLFLQELFKSTPLCVATVVMCWLYLMIYCESIFIGTAGIFMLIFTVAPAYFVYYPFSTYFGLYHIVMIQLMIFLGTHSLVVFIDYWYVRARFLLCVSPLLSFFFSITPPSSSSLPPFSHSKKTCAFNA